MLIPIFMVFLKEVFGGIFKSWCILFIVVQIPHDLFSLADGITRYRQQGPSTFENYGTFIK